MGRGDHPFGPSPVHLNESLEKARRLRSYDEAVKQYRKRYRERDWRGPQRYHDVSLVSIPWATLSSGSFLRWSVTSPRAAINFVEQRDQIRWTRTAIGLRRFRLVEGHFPDSLEELAQVGVLPSTWTMPDKIPFGYRFESDASDARLWIYDSRNGWSNRRKPPSERWQNDQADVEAHELHLTSSSL